MNLQQLIALLPEYERALNSGRAREILPSILEVWENEFLGPLLPIFAKAYAMALWEVRDLSTAEEVLRLGLRHSRDELPLRASLCLTLGNVLNDQGQLEDAEKTLRLALEDIWRLTSEDSSKHQSEFAMAHNNLANVLVKSGRYREAEDLYSSAVDILSRQARIQPKLFGQEHARALQNLSDLQLREGRFEDSAATDRLAIEVLTKLAEADPQSLAYLAETYVSVANRACKGGRFEESEASYRRALELYVQFDAAGSPVHAPQYAYALTAQAIFFRDLGRFKDAEHSFRDAGDLFQSWVEQGDTTLEPALAFSWKALGEVLMTRGRYEESEHLYRSALEILRRRCIDEPQAYELMVAETYMSLGEVLFHRGRFEESEASFQSALEMNRRLAEASADHESILASAYRNLGSVQWNLGAVSQAELSTLAACEILERLVQERPNDSVRALELARALKTLGNIRRRQGRLVEAEELFRSAIAMRERFATEIPAAFAFEQADLLTNMGGVLFDTGRENEGVVALRSAIKIRHVLAKDDPLAFEPALAVNLHQLGFQLAVTGDKANARKEFGDALDLSDRVLRTRITWGDQSEALRIRHLSLTYLSHLTDSPHESWKLSNLARDSFLFAMRADYLPDLSEADRTEVSRLRNRVRLLEERLSRLAAQENLEPEQVVAQAEIQGERADLDHRIGVLLSALTGYAPIGGSRS